MHFYRVPHCGVLALVSRNRSPADAEARMRFVRGRVLQLEDPARDLLDSHNKLQAKGAKFVWLGGMQCKLAFRMCNCVAAHGIKVYQASEEPRNTFIAWLPASTKQRANADRPSCGGSDAQANAGLEAIRLSHALRGFDALGMSETRTHCRSDIAAGEPATLSDPALWAGLRRASGAVDAFNLGMGLLSSESVGILQLAPRNDVERPKAPANTPAQSFGRVVARKLFLRQLGGPFRLAM